METNICANYADSMKAQLCQFRMFMIPVGPYIHTIKKEENMCRTAGFLTLSIFIVCSS